MQEFMNSLDFEFSLHFNSDYAFSNCGWSFKLNRELTPITDFTDIFPFHFPYDTSKFVYITIYDDLICSQEKGKGSIYTKFDWLFNGN